jgi:cellobiose-specific phosphotransferase system component IIC
MKKAAILSLALLIVGSIVVLVICVPLSVFFADLTSLFELLAMIVIMAFGILAITINNKLAED